MKADRLVSLLLLLQTSQRRTARDLAARLEVSERTIYRDVDALSASGIPVYASRGSEGGIALSEGYRQALLHFGDDEVRALFMTGAGVLADLGLGPNFDRALEKLRGGFSALQQRAAEKARGRVHVDQRRWNQGDPPTDTLAALRRAVWDDRCVEIVYDDRARVRTTRVVEPYGLVSKAGVWYLVAKTPDGFRSFRVERIRDVRERSEHYERDPAFDLDSHWRAAAAQMQAGIERFPVILRVSAEMYDAICGFWPTEPVAPDDPYVVRIQFSSENAAVSHLASWAQAVTLIEPLALRERVAEHARGLLELYSTR